MTRTIVAGLFTLSLSFVTPNCLGAEKSSHDHGGANASREEVEAHFAAVAAGSPELHLRADRATRYEKVADILAAAQRAGIVKIAFVTESAPKN